MQSEPVDIELIALTKRYGQAVAVDGIDLDVCEGDLFDAENNDDQTTPTTLTGEQIKSLFEDLQVLVPRPWDSK